MTIRFESKCKNGTREERSRNEVLWQRMRLNPRRGSRSFFSLGCSRFFCCFRETARAVWAAGDEEGSRLEEAREQAKRGCCRLTNYTRSTRFTGDASSETIVHPRSFLYLFTLLFGRLCPPQKLDAAGSGSAACLHATVKRNERGRETARESQGNEPWIVSLATKSGNLDRERESGSRSSVIGPRFSLKPADETR